MDQKALEVELKKISTQQIQWHDEFIQREKHWGFQRFVWVITITIAITAIATKAILTM